MRILVTGHRGYIGSVLVPALGRHGHDVVGYDADLFAGCTLGPDAEPIPETCADIRDITPQHLDGVDAVVHLGALSNDPLGDLDADLTFDINHRGTLRVAAAAKAAGVRRFVFASSCSLYGAHGDAPIDESAAFNPVTPYGRSKVLAEEGLAALADDDFSPTFLRNATAYGMSPRLRGDLVLNNLVGYAVTTGEVRMKSDGSPWRPLVHIEDIAAAIVEVLHAPRHLVHLEAFNVGRSEENYRIREIAELVEAAVPGSRITFADAAGPDARNYRVCCDKIADVLPGYRPAWTVADGAAQLRDAYVAHGLRLDDLVGPRLSRIAHITRELGRQRLDPSLRWWDGHPPVGEELVDRA